MAERPKVPLKLDEPDAFTAKFGSAGRSGAHNGHAWHLWTVEIDEEDYSLFADDDLNAILEDAQLSRGDQVVVTKKKKSKGVYYWTVGINGQRVAPLADDPAPAQPTRQPPQKQPTNGQPAASPPREKVHGDADITLDGLAQLMEQCILYADAAWGQLAEQHGTSYTADNVQGTASTLFIEARDHNLTVQKKHPAAVAREAVLAGANGSDGSQPPWVDEEAPPLDDEYPF